MQLINRRAMLFSDLDEQINSMIRVSPADGIHPRLYACLICSKESRHRTHIVNHCESHHIETPGFPCNICHKRSKTRQALKMHIKKIHQTPNKMSELEMYFEETN
jgi:hypothetical protein